MRYLSEAGDMWISPTEIGLAIGKKEYTSASSWASSSLKPLVQKGLVKRSSKGRYKLVQDSEFAQIARDYHGGAVRDNSLSELASIGKAIESGEDDNEGSDCL